MASDHPSLRSEGSGTTLEESYRELRRVSLPNWQHIPSYVHPHLREEVSFQSSESPPHLSAPQTETPSDKEEMRASSQPDPLSFTTLDSSLPLTAMTSDDTDQLVETSSANTFPAEFTRQQNSRSTTAAVSLEAHDNLPMHPLPLFHRALPSSLESFRAETLQQQTGALSSEAINISTTVEHGSVSSDNEHLYHLDTESRTSSAADVMAAYWPLPEPRTESSQSPPIEAVQSFSPNSDPDGGMTLPGREESLSPYSDPDGGMTPQAREQHFSPNSDPGGSVTYPGREQGGDHDSSIESQNGSHNPRHSGAATQPTTSPSPSLQEMFFLKKQNFIQRSQSRVQLMEANARERVISEAQKTGRPTYHTPGRSSHTRVAIKSHAWGKSRADYTPPAVEGDSGAATSHKRRAVSFSSPLLRSQHSGIFTPPVIHKSELTVDHACTVHAYTFLHLSPCILSLCCIVLR